MTLIFTFEAKKFYLMLCSLLYPNVFAEYMYVRASEFKALHANFFHSQVVVETVCTIQCDLFKVA